MLKRALNRLNERRRAEALCGPVARGEAVKQPSPAKPAKTRLIAVLLCLSICICIGAFAFRAPYTGLAALVITWALPGALARKRLRQRAELFSTDYPSLLLATAASIRVGLTATEALERAACLLPRDSIVRQEVDRLVRGLNTGQSAADAVRAFGDGIPLPELALFRSAFVLVNEHGGAFGPTLERLAQVTAARRILVRSALTSTASMRMTANVLLLVTPMLIGIVALHTDGYFDTLTGNTAARACATIGATMIAGGFLSIRRMSAFQP